MRTFWNKKSPTDRFWKHVNKTDTCWEWTAALDAGGYGKFNNGHRIVSAHRFSYEDRIGSIPEGLCLDHICRNRKCVNPDHLNPCTLAENTQAPGSLAGAHNASKTCCPKGHEYSGSNLYVFPDGRRDCQTCRRAARLKNRPLKRGPRAKNISSVG